MKVEQTTVTKLAIYGLEYCDPIAVYLEDLGPGYGKITITCFDDSWSYTWNAMGKGCDIRSFFLSCDEYYLAGKLSPSTEHRIYDLDKMVDHAKKYICNERRNDGFGKDEARELFDDASSLDGCHCSCDLDAELMYRIFGDEWWHEIPKGPNHKYEYLCRIINTVKAALKEI